MNNLHSTTSTDISLQANTNIHAGNDDDDDDDIPEQIETVIEILLNGLRDKVRYNAPVSSHFLLCNRFSNPTGPIGYNC